MTPATTVGPALGVSTARKGAVAGLELTCSAPVIHVVWAGAAAQVLPGGRTAGQAELGAGFPVIPIRVFGTVSAGHGSDGTFLGVSLPTLLPSAGSSNTVVMISPYLRCFPWELRGVDLEIGFGVKVLLSVPKVHLRY